MGEHYFDIILFAMIAAFLILRLRSVLGRRTGQERRPDPVLRRVEAPGDKVADKVVALGSRNPAAPPPVVTATPADAVAAGLERIGAADALQTRIIALKRLDITEAGLSGSIARVTVKFVSDQVNVLRAHDGSVVDGDPDHAVEKTDFWSFSRDTRANDPNWVLQATASG